MLVVKKYLYEILEALEKEDKNTMDIMREVCNSKYNIIARNSLEFAEEKGLVAKRRGEKNEMIYSLTSKGRKFLDSARELNHLLEVW